jgi:dihydrofolate synthase/folylpolyglutamate synthase
MPEDQLAAIAATYGLTGHHFPGVNIALQNALSHARKDDLVLGCGSVFVVGEVERDF